MSDLRVGQSVELVDGRFGVVRFVGEPHFAPGVWVGVELEDDSGKNDGSVQGERYFECPMGKGMFLRPAAVSIIEQPPEKAKAARENGGVKKAPRPSSVVGAQGKRLSTAPDSAIGKRMSMNAASPSPAARPPRPSSMLRSPTKSPTKQLASSGASGASSPRVGTPSYRTPSLTAAKPRPAGPSSRVSMGPPQLPASKTARPSLAGVNSSNGRLGAAASRSLSGRVSLAPKPAPRIPSSKLASIDARLGRGQGNDPSGGDDSDGRTENSGVISPKVLSPALSRASATEKGMGSPPASSMGPGSPGSQRSTAASATTNREIEDLKTKLRLVEKKRVEDRDKLRALEKVQEERDRFESVIQKLQAKYQPQQQEIIDLRRELKESAARYDEVENMQAEHDVVVEMATLDREMAEETAEVLKTELEALKLKAEELELELEVLREENAELGQEMSPEEKSSHGWIQMERNNERLREALLRLRDMTQQQEEELKDQVKNLEEDVQDLGNVKNQYETTKEKLAQAEGGIEDLRQQLDNALGAEDMIEELTEKNMGLSEQIDELKMAVEDLESLKELNDELEINHIETEKDMQEDIDFKDSVIAEQMRRATQQDATLEDMEYTLSRFRELVSNLQSDLEDMRASHAVTETESEQLTSRSRAMMDLNMKLQLSAAKTQVKTIDLELRRLDAQQAAEHLAIVQLFLPEAYLADRDSVLALLRFKRVGFKASLLLGFVKERVSGHNLEGHEDDAFASFDALDKLTWVSAMCDRFVNAISHCSTEQFAKFEGALYELEPVERALNAWIDGLRRDELKEKNIATELQRTIALMSHLAESHIPNELDNFADEIHMRLLVMQNQLESTATALSIARTMVESKVGSASEENEEAQRFSKRSEQAMSSTRSAKVILSKTVRAVEDLKARSLSGMPESIQLFEQCESSTTELASFSRSFGEDLYQLLNEEGRTESFTYAEVQSTVYGTAMRLFSSSESDLFSTFSNKLRSLTSSLTELSLLATDLESTQEFERSAMPWVLRSQEASSSKATSLDSEEELRRLREETHERARLVAVRDRALEEAAVKIELLESRTRDATRKNERIGELERRLAEAAAAEARLSAAVAAQDKELSGMEAEREKWKKMAGDHASGVTGDAGPGGETTAAGGPGGGGARGVGGGGQPERAAATARETEALKTEIAGLQAAVRFLRGDSVGGGGGGDGGGRASLADPRTWDWLDAPLLPTAEKSRAEQRRALVAREGQEVLGELLNLARAAETYDLGGMPANKLAWRPVGSTPQYHVARQREDYAAWKGWSGAVAEKCRASLAPPRGKGAGVGGSGVGRGGHGRTQATITLNLPDSGGAGAGGKRLGGEVEIVDPNDFDALRSSLGLV